MNRCAVSGERVRANAEPHHIFNRGLGHNGCDCQINLIWLSDEYHTGPQGVHSVGRETFFLRLHPELAPIFLSAQEHNWARERGEHLPCLNSKRWK